MPKPGFYYYEGQRALRGLIILGPSVLILYLSKKGFPSLEAISNFILAYRIYMVVGVFVLVPVIFGLFHFMPRTREPRPAWFKSRKDFLRALEEYRKFKGYQPGWLYYRTNELWPE